MHHTWCSASLGRDVVIITRSLVGFGAVFLKIPGSDFNNTLTTLSRKTLKSVRGAEAHLADEQQGAAKREGRRHCGRRGLAHMH